MKFVTDQRGHVPPHECVHGDTYQKKEAGQYGNGGAENEAGDEWRVEWSACGRGAGGGNLGGGGGHNDCQAKLAALFEADQSDPASPSTPRRRS